ncbi:MAG TPA: phosphoglycerate dehydrogenase [Armatimonadota bacterium]|jgi:D-3-phosphoglycerate dehydrogenase
MSIRILVADPIAEEGVERLKQVGEVDVITKQTPEQLAANLPNYDALVVRSETKVTADVLASVGSRLKVIGRAGVGVDNIDLPAATNKGILVVNSPEGNTLAAAEHTMAMLMSVARNVPNAVASMRAGEWKRSQFTGVQLYGKTLGVVGLGKIGREVVARAKAFEMNILAYDPYLSAESAERLGVSLSDLDTIFRKSDFITFHVPLTPQTRNLVGAEQLAVMKPTVRLVNVARGGIINEAALRAAIDDGRVAGAAIDVYEKEPVPADSPLLGSPKIITTPHLGASTQEAQIAVVMDVAEQIADIMAGRPARAAVNMPAIDATVFVTLKPYLALAEKIGRLHAQLRASRTKSVAISYSGDIASMDVRPVTRAVLKGLLDLILPESVNYVNAPVLAEQRGIKVTESRTDDDSDYTDLITVTITNETGEHTIAGAKFGAKDIRIVEIEGFRVDIEPTGFALMVRHHDQPGMIGKVGTLLGNNNVNIAGMQVGRHERRGLALMILGVDDPIPEPLLQELSKLEGMENAKPIEF